MNDSWIAVADCRGLKLLVLETQHALQFVMKRAIRENAECFWAVLQPQHAQFVNQQLHQGNTGQALILLERLASELGQLAPSPAVCPSWMTEDVTIPEDCDREWNQ